MPKQNSNTLDEIMVEVYRAEILHCGVDCI